MTMPNLTVWLVPSVLLMAWGVLAVALDRRRGDALTGIALLLAGAALALTALVRYGVLATEGIVTMLQVLVLGAVLVCVAVVMTLEPPPR
ncbi:MAG: hypothetical protein RBT60_05310 [Candidatus Krumholzibacteria bacterium]|jgi:hypothetical protein|nr:hypothetical protein [Candidatus Krumholzibacteria bacterium]